MKTLKNCSFKVLKIKREIVLLHPLKQRCGRYRNPFSGESRIKGLKSKQKQTLLWDGRIQIL